MKTLWEKLSEEHREQLLKTDRGEFWKDRLTNYISIVEISIVHWVYLRNDLGFETIDETFRNTFDW